MDYSLVQKNLLSQLARTLTRALEFYHIDPTSNTFDVLTSIVEACAAAGMTLKPSHRKAISEISHYEKPYYYSIDHRTGKVSYAIGGGVPDAFSDPAHAKSAPTPVDTLTGTPVTSEGNDG